MLDEDECLPVKRTAPNAFHRTVTTRSASSVPVDALVTLARWETQIVMGKTLAILLWQQWLPAGRST